MAQEGLHYKCLRFNPTEEEVFEEFLAPRIANNQEELLLSLIEDFDFYAFDLAMADKGIHLFFQPLQFWFFVVKERFSPNSNKPSRGIRNQVGRWKPFGRAKHITRGLVNLGIRKSFDHLNNNGLMTGWRQHEYDAGNDGINVEDFFIDQADGIIQETS